MRGGAAVLFVLSVLAGTWLDARVRHSTTDGVVLEADLHVHPYPGDGALTVAQLQREARRRRLDVIAVTSHNHMAGYRLAEFVGTDMRDPIVLPGQEITAPDYHLIAVGIRQVVDWRLTAQEAIQAIHVQGGVAIAAHPVDRSWRVHDGAALSALDGVEVAHPMAADDANRVELDRFFERVRDVNPAVAPIGSSDFHTSAPLGRCRTFVIASDRSAGAVLDAIRAGRTVAMDSRGRLTGRAEHVAATTEHIAASPRARLPSATEKTAGLASLLMLAILVWPKRRGTIRRQVDRTDPASSSR